MINQALFDVVKNQLAIGVSETEIKEFLRRRGTSEPEIQELFNALSVQSVTIRDIPVSSMSTEQVPPVSGVQASVAPQPGQNVVIPEPAMQQESIPQTIPVEQPLRVPTQSEAHGIVRDIPPLQPSVPFNAISQEQPLVAQLNVSTAASITSSVVFEAQASAASTNKKMIIRAGVGVVALIALVLGGYFVYSSYFASPDMVMDTMISRLRDVRSGEFAVDVTATTDSLSELASTSTAANPFLKAFAISGPVTFALHASGTIDALDEQKPTVAISFSSTMDKWPGGDFSLGAEYRNIDRINYIKINNVPNLGFLNVDFLKNQWFQAGDSEAKAQLGVDSSSSLSSVVPTISQDQRDRLAAAYKAHRFLIVTKVLESEDLDGASMHHYQLSYDKEALKQLNVETNKILGRGDAPAEVSAVDEDLNLATVNNLEIWIGKRDGLPHKLVANVSMQDKTDPSKKTDASLTMAGNKFNTSLAVAVPEGTKSIEEALKGIFGQMLAGGSEKKPAPTTLKDRNDQRKIDVVAIANAIKQGMNDNGGTFVCAAGPLPTVATFMGAAGFGMSGYDIKPCLVPMYLLTMPRDPSKGTATMTGYSVLYNAKTKKVTARAPYTEGGGAMISATK